MTNVFAADVLAFGVTLAVAGLLRLAGGTERGARIAGLGIAVGFAAGWILATSPGWMAQDAFDRTGHIVLGGAVVGLVLDFLAPRRFWVLAATAVFVLVCALSEVNDGLQLTPRPTPAVIAMTAAAAVVAFVILFRLRHLAADGPTALVLTIVAALGLAAVAGIAGAANVAATALVLAAAAAGYSVWAWSLGFPVREAALLASGGALMAAAWALVQQAPGTLLSVVVLPLTLFADGTARRVPLPKARVREVLFPLILAAVAALPAVLAAALAYVGTK